MEDIMRKVKPEDLNQGKGGSKGGDGCNPNSLFITKENLADNPPRHPGLQDLDIWTEEQMRKWIMKRIERDIHISSTLSQISADLTKIL